MNNETSRRGNSHLQLILIALIFTVPLIAASWMYFSDNAVRPVGMTNNGVLLDPIVNLPEELGNSPLLTAAENRWMLVYLLSGDCAETCQDSLYKLRQMRLMLGNDMSRVVRVWLHGSQAPDTLRLEQDHPGLVAVHDAAARQLLADVHPRGMSSVGFYLLDPLGNLIMYFPEDVAPRELVDDLERLLKLSHIG